MSLFKNESLDYVDYTLLQKKGILKVKEQKNDIIDYTSTFTQANSAPSAPADLTAPQSQASSQASDFGSFFGSVDANPPSNVSGTYESPFSALDNPNSTLPSAASTTHLTNHPDINALKIKLEDFEYKVERLLERLAKIESKLT